MANSIDTHHRLHFTVAALKSKPEVTTVDAETVSKLVTFNEKQLQEAVSIP